MALTSADIPGADDDEDDLLAPEPAKLTGALIGYARVSTSGQNLDRQTRALTEAGCIRLHGKGDEVRTVPLPPVGREHLAAWLDERTHDGPLWTGQRGRLTISGITQVVLAVGEDAGIPGLRPTGSATPTPPASAKAAPTPPKSRHFSARPSSKPPPATSAPATSNKPPSSTASSRNQPGPPTSERWMAITPSPQAR